jgi:hypothetical protein
MYWYPPYTIVVIDNTPKAIMPKIPPIPIPSESLSEEEEEEDEDV